MMDIMMNHRTLSRLYGFLGFLSTIILGVPVSDKIESSKTESQVTTIEFEHNGIFVPVDFVDGEVMVSESELARIFNKNQSTVNRRLKELEKRLEGNVLAKYADLHMSRNTLSGKQHVRKYNIEYFIRLGYMFDGEAAEKFQVWATEHLKNIITKGVSADSAVLETLTPDQQREAVLAPQRAMLKGKGLHAWFTELASQASDYKPSEHIHFVSSCINDSYCMVVGMDAQKLVASRLNPNDAFMGVKSFSGNKPKAEEAKVARNFLSEKELVLWEQLLLGVYVSMQGRLAMSGGFCMKDLTKAILDQGKVMMGSPHQSNPSFIRSKDVSNMVDREFNAWKQKENKVVQLTLPEVK